MVSLEKMDLQELVKDLMGIGNLIDEAQESRSVHAPPEIQARGKAQLPALLKCEEILSSELHRRFGGYTELAEVAIDAMEEHIQEVETRAILAATFGPLESNEDAAKREAEEREALGCTIADIEDAERKADEEFEAEHPEIVCNLEMLYTAKEHINTAIAKEEAQRRADEQDEFGQAQAIETERIQEALRASGADSEVAGSPLEFHKPGKCVAILDPEWHKPGTPIRYIDDPSLFTDTEPEGLPRYLKLPRCLQSEDHDPILWAMKEAAWSSLQRVQTHTLVEYMELWIKKHHDYGVENHAIWGCEGAIIRATDKLMRLKGHYFDGRMMLTDKTEDDWLDLIGYGLIGLVVERGQWPITTLEAVLEDMEGGFRDNAFEHVIKAMEAKMEEQPTIRCPSCNGENVQATTVLLSPVSDWYKIVLKCGSCGEERDGTTAVAETIDEAIRRIAQGWDCEWEEYRREHD